VVCDALDGPAITRAIAGAQPEVVVHQLTDLPTVIKPRAYGKALVGTNRLRRETGATFARAAREAGARRLVAQSISFLLAPEGPAVRDEQARPWDDAPEPFGEAVRSALALERAVTGEPGLEGVVLRYGFFYGPGTSYGPGGGITHEVARRRFPVIGDGAGVFSFVHVDDAAAATVLALDRGAPGVFHITDDEPAAMRDWLPIFAAAAGAPAPRRVPLWLARLVAGPYFPRAAASMRGAGNEKARRELGWEPAHGSWRAGFAASL
jgi:nucleoside-diphosphate-sugar epimerase